MAKDFSRDRAVYEALLTLHEKGAHAYAIGWLVQEMQRSYERVCDQAATRGASLRAVKKFNKGKNKEIDLMCELDERTLAEKFSNIPPYWEG